MSALPAGCKLGRYVQIEFLLRMAYVSENHYAKVCR